MTQDEITRLEKTHPESSNVNFFSYDEATKVMVIGFGERDCYSARVYRYTEVPASTYEELLAAASKGVYVNHHIGSDFPYEMVGELVYDGTFVPAK